MLPIRTENLIRQVLIMVALMTVCSGIVYAGDGTGSFAIIDNAYESGKIDRTEMLFEQMKAFFAPQDLASEYKTTSPTLIKSGTALVMEVYDSWDNFTPDQQTLMSSYLGRLEKQCTYDTPGGFFKIQYDTSGGEPVPDEDLDDDSIPDYVERTAIYLDSAFSSYSAMGYLPPPSDDGAGGDDKYDVYLVSISGYGMTAPDGAGDSVWNDSKSYIWIHNSFDQPWFPANDDPEGDIIGAQKVTCAHEFFHATQLAYVYDYSEFVWIMESSATWMEEVLFPEVNDNYNYLPYFFTKPDVGLTIDDIFQKYGLFIWSAFLWQKYDESVMLHLWEASRYNNSRTSTDSALAPHGSSLTGIFPEFTIWNYYTGERAIPGMYFADAADYPAIEIDQSLPTLVNDSIQPIDAPDGLACNYIQLEVDVTASGILEILLEGSLLVRWGNTAIFTDIGDDTIITEISDVTDPIYIYLPFIEDYEMVTIMPTVISHYLTDNNYYLSTKLQPYGDANFDRDANVGDATYLINYVFFGGPAPVPIVESGDANCDNDVNVADAVKIINYVFKNGDAPCADRIPQ